jgi:hypothetical protein
MPFPNLQGSIWLGQRQRFQNDVVCNYFKCKTRGMNPQYNHVCNPQYNHMSNPQYEIYSVNDCILRRQLVKKSSTQCIPSLEFGKRGRYVTLGQIEWILFSYWTYHPMDVGGFLRLFIKSGRKIMPTMESKAFQKHAGRMLPLPFISLIRPSGRSNRRCDQFQHEQ